MEYLIVVYAAWNLRSIDMNVYIHAKSLSPLSNELTYIYRCRSRELEWLLPKLGAIDLKYTQLHKKICIHTFSIHCIK